MALAERLTLVSSALWGWHYCNSVAWGQRNIEAGVTSVENAAIEDYGYLRAQFARVAVVQSSVKTAVLAGQTLQEPPQRFVFGYFQLHA